MNPVIRIVVLVLSAGFCGAAAFGITYSLVTPPPPRPVRVPGGPPQLASEGPSKTATGVASVAAPVLGVGAHRQAYVNGSYTGPPESAYYGVVSVRLNVQGGRVVGIRVLRYPSDNPTSRSINSQALPYLKREVIRAQTVNVAMVSGATLSSGAFLRSADMALRQARG